MKKTLKIILSAMLLCCVLFVLASCGDDDKGAQDNGGANGDGAADNGGGSDSGEPAEPEAKSFLKKAETGERNNYNGSVGYEILAIEDMQVSAVGRPVSGSMEQSHTIYIWEVSTETLMASATITPDSPTDALGFKTAKLDGQILFQAGEYYRIVSAEYEDGDMWYDIGTAAEDPIPDLQPNAEAEISTPVFTGADAHDSYPGNTYNPGGIRGYTGLTFYYLPPAAG